MFVPKYLLVLALFAAGVNTRVYAEEIFVVKRVLDGETIEISGGRTVQLMGVDAPSFADIRRNNANAKKRAISPQVVNRFARRARDYVDLKVKDKKVILVFDEVDDRSDNENPREKLRAYVYLATELPKDMADQTQHIHGHFEILDDKLPHFHLNASIIKYGYGFADESDVYTRKGDFQRLEYLARRNQRGLWREGK